MSEKRVAVVTFECAADADTAFDILNKLGLRPERCEMLSRTYHEHTQRVVAMALDSILDMAKRENNRV